MASDHIELWAEILKRLSSVKTLIKFQFVCKSWNSLISSRFFTDHHFNFNSNSTTEPPTYLRELCDYKASYVLHNQDNTTTNVDFPFFQSQLRVKSFEVIHGVVCLAYTLDHNIYPSQFIAFWNPTIRKLVSTSIPFESDSVDLYKFLGFGFDSSKNDFKSVWSPFSSDYYEVFSARDGKWRKKKLPESSNHGVFRSHSCFVNGTIHWIQYTSQETNTWPRTRRISPHGLLLFECEREEFTTMDIPSLVGALYGEAEVFVCRGSLSVLISGWRDGTEVYEWWTMNENGVTSTWTKTRIIEGHGVNTIISRSRRLTIAYEEIDDHVIRRFAFVFKESMLLMDIGQTEVPEY